VLLEFEIDTFGREVLVAVEAVGFSEAGPEPFRLIQLGGANRNSIFRFQAGLGSAAAQVPQKRRPVGGMDGPAATGPSPSKPATTPSPPRTRYPTNSA